MPDFTYRVEVSEPDDIPCICGTCGRKALSGELGNLDDCALTPGDPSPMGRCPDEECDRLAYPDRPEDWEKDAAADMLAALKELTSSFDDGKQPAQRMWQTARAAIAKAEGRKP